MSTLLKFTFTLGIELFAAALLLSFIVIYICYKLGNKQYKKDYEKKYNYLKLLVEHSVVNAPTKKAIKEKFDEISTYSCKDYEKLQVLEKAFIQKFANRRRSGNLHLMGTGNYCPDCGGLCGNDKHNRRW